MKGSLKSLVLILLFCSLILNGCKNTALSAGGEAEPVINMPNPATVYCEEQGGAIEMRTGENGMVGICHFSDGSTCDEWAFFRGECKPGLNLSETSPIFGWYGSVISPPANQPFAYYLTL